MGLQNASILAGATITPSGGTAQNFVPDGVEVKNGIHLVDSAVTDFRTRPSLTAKTNQPTTLPDGSFSKDKRVLTYAEPFVDSKGVVQYDYIQIIRRVHPESSAAKAAGMLTKGAQLCTDADFVNFWALGSLA